MTDNNNITNVEEVLNNYNSKLTDDLSVIDTFDRKKIFVYCSIFVMSLVFFNRISIGLNIILGLFIAFAIVKYLFDKDQKITKKNDLYNSIKKEYIQPKPKLLNNYTDVVNYLFSIQDFYKHNQQAYEELVDSMDDFFYLYEECHKLPQLSGLNYKLMEKLKYNSLNALQSMVYKLPASKQYTDKLNLAVDVLEKMLNGYLNEIYEINNKNILTKGYSTETILIGKNDPKPYSFYDNNGYGKHYEFF